MFLKSSKITYISKINAILLVAKLTSSYNITRYVSKQQ